MDILDNPEKVFFVCNNYWQTTCKHRIDAPHETPHLYDFEGDFHPSKIEAGDRVFVKTDFLDAFLARVRPSIAVPFVLVTGHSDLSPSPEAVAFVGRDPGIAAWEAQNIEFETDKIKALPMGLSEPSRPIGDQSAFVLALGDRKKARKLAVPAMGVTHPVRAGLRIAIEELADGVYGNLFDIPEGRQSPPDYLDLLGRNEYVLAPRGNAIDIHRVAEAVLMRTVPVYVGEPVPAFYRHLPVLLLQPNGPDDTLTAMLERFLEAMCDGTLPPLPTPEEWEKYIEQITIPNGGYAVPSHLRNANLPSDHSM